MLIVEFEWDDTNEAHLARHGLHPTQVNGMLGSRITAVKNKRTGSGAYKLIGRTGGGILVTVVVAHTAVAGRWRPITGRRSSDAEARLYGR